MGISRDHWHKRRATGGKRAPIRKKRKFELARPAAMTKLGLPRIHPVRCRGGNKKFRALRLDGGNFAWGSEAITRKTRKFCPFFRLFPNRNVNVCDSFSSFFHGICPYFHQFASLYYRYH